MGSGLKAISFLGCSPYNSVTYLHPEGTDTCTTAFFQEALVRFYQPEVLYVLLTNRARTECPPCRDISNWDALCACLAGSTRVEPVPIPEGRRPDELWAIFDGLTSCLSRGDEVVFDITHGFRSLPLLAVIAMGFLRVVRDIHIRALLYGAYEARDTEGKAPTFDLFPMVTLLDWTTATDKFRRSGDASELADLLRQRSKSVYQSGGSGREPPRHLSALAEHIERLSQALALARPAEVSEEAREIGKRLPKAEGEVELWVRPFAALLEHTRDAYQPLAPTDPDDPKEVLAAQWRLVQWYLDREQVVQAATLAREWVVSAFAWRQGLCWNERATRTRVEDSLCAWESQGSGKPHDPEQLPPAALRQEAPDTPRLWAKLREARNQIAHCGVGRDRVRVERLVGDVLGLRRHLEQLAGAFGLGDGAD